MKYNILLQFLFVVLLFFSCNTKNKSNDKSTVGIVNNQEKKGQIKIDTLSILTKAVSSIKDYHIAYWRKGDIDNDQQDDFILVMESNKIYKEPFDNTHLIKITLLKSINFSNFNILASNDNLVECSTCRNGGGGAPLQEIAIDSSLISFGITYGLCPETYNVITFKFEKGNFYLHSTNREDFSCNELDEDGDRKITYYEEKTRKDFGWVKFKDYFVD